MSGSTTTERVPTESPLLWPALALLVIAVALFTVFWDGHRSLFPYSTAKGPLVWPPPPDAASSASGDGSAPTAPVVAALGAFTGLKLPDGVELNIPKLGVENKLIDWIESSNPVDTTTWFDFDRLLFATGSATLEPASQEQLNNVAAILKAYPKVKIKLGGYTDNTGDPAANLKLSDDRAKSVEAELVKLGIDPARMQAEGYGQDHPVADNKTEEGRQLNRRISLRVTEK